MRVSSRILASMVVASSIAIVGFGYQLLAVASPLRDSWRTTRGLQETLQAVTDAETSQRGFLITGLGGYLEPYRRSRPVVREYLARLRVLARGSPTMQQQILTLSDLVDAKYAEMDKTINLRRRIGQKAAVILVITGIGKARMDRIRLLVDRLQDDQWQRLQTYDQWRSSALRRLIVGVVILLLSAVSLFTIIIRHPEVIMASPKTTPRQTSYPRPPKQTSHPAGGKLPLMGTKTNGPARPNDGSQDRGQK